MNELYRLVREYLDATEGNVHYTDAQFFLRRKLRRATTENPYLPADFKERLEAKEAQHAQQSRDEQVQGGEAAQRQSDGAESLQSEAGGGDNALGEEERSGNG